MIPVSYTHLDVYKRQNFSFLILKDSLSENFRDMFSPRYLKLVVYFISPYVVFRHVYENLNRVVKGDLEASFPSISLRSSTCFLGSSSEWAQMARLSAKAKQLNSTEWN